jgi:hypothetical protein
VDGSRAANLIAQERRAQALKERLRGGLAGQKVGKHFVKEGEVDVQLGEDLSESFRALKVGSLPLGANSLTNNNLNATQPEGNLFRDRFLSLQHRGLVEPRGLQRYVPTLYLTQALIVAMFTAGKNASRRQRSMRSMHGNGSTAIKYDTSLDRFDSAPLWKFIPATETAADL